MIQMVKKTGLGKGLDALFSMPVVEEEKRQEGDGLQNLKIIDIEPNREQPRKHFDEESISELSESIKMYGVIQPIVVTKKEGYYAIVAGERRWRAAKQAGLKEIPAIIRDGDDRKNKEIALIENMQREDLNAFEKAGVTASKVTCDNPVTTADFFELGLTGGANSKEKRKALCAELDLPEFLSVSSLISCINNMMSKEEFAEKVKAMRN